MGLLTSWLSDLRASYAADDDFWYRADPRAGAGGVQAGVPVSSDSAMRLSAFYACVTLLADMVSGLPLILYRRREDDGKDRAREHRWYRALRQQPNEWQTAAEWRQLGVFDMILKGNFYSQIVDDRRDPQLVRLNPDRTRVVQLDSGRRGYLYRPRTGPERALTQDEVLHVMRFSLDGVEGVSVVEYAREAIGAAQAQEGYAARFWSQSAEPNGTLTVPGSLQEPQRIQLKKAWHEAHSGLAGAHRIALLEGGVKWERTSLSGRDAQYIESRQHSVSELARFLRVPPHMIGDVERATSWGTGIEQQTLGFVNFTLMPLLVAFEQAIQRDLLGDEHEELFAEHLVEGLLRGDIQSRYQAYQIALGTSNNRPFMTQNEVRRRENLDPWPDGDSTEPPAPAVPDRPAPASAPEPRRPQPPTRAQVVATGAAATAVQRELAAIRRQATAKHLADTDGWRTWVDRFFARHAAFVSELLGIPLEAAQGYARDHRADLLARGLEALVDWERDAPGALAALALEEGDDGAVAAV